MSNQPDYEFEAVALVRHEAILSRLSDMTDRLRDLDARLSSIEDTVRASVARIEHAAKPTSPLVPAAAGVGGGTLIAAIIEAIQRLVP